MAVLKSIYVEQCTWSEVDDFIASRNGRAIAAWGWGATEQHGQRMPENTDTLITNYFIDLMAQNRSIIIFPTMPIGRSHHHENFAGTTSFSTEVAVGFASGVLRSIYRTGIRNLFAFMGHGGNVSPFHGALTALGKEIEGLKIWEGFDKLFYVTEGELGRLIKSFDEQPSHAGALEASVLYAILTELGRADEVERLMNIPITDEMITFGVHGQGTQGGDPNVFQKMFPHGSKGDQRKADVNVGLHILRLMEELLLSEFDNFANS